VRGGWGLHSRCPGGTLGAVPAGASEEPAEGDAEVPVEDGVDEGVEAAVAVADPEEAAE